MSFCAYLSSGLQAYLGLPHLYFQTSPENNILDKLSLKRLLTLKAEVKSIFKLQDINLSLNKF